MMAISGDQAGVGRFVVTQCRAGLPDEATNRREAADRPIAPLHFRSATHSATAGVERLPRVMPLLSTHARDTFRCNCDVVSRAVIAHRRMSQRPMPQWSSAFFRESGIVMNRSVP